MLACDDIRWAFRCPLANGDLGKCFTFRGIRSRANKISCVQLNAVVSVENVTRTRAQAMGVCLLAVGQHHMCQLLGLRLVFGASLCGHGDRVEIQTKKQSATNTQLQLKYTVLCAAYEKAPVALAQRVAKTASTCCCCCWRCWRCWLPAHASHIHQSRMPYATSVLATAASAATVFCALDADMFRFVVLCVFFIAHDWKSRTAIERSSIAHCVYDCLCCLLNGSAGAMVPRFYERDAHRVQTPTNRRHVLYDLPMLCPGCRLH